MQGQDKAHTLCTKYLEREGMSACQQTGFKPCEPTCNGTQHQGIIPQRAILLPHHAGHGNVDAVPLDSTTPQ